MDDKALFYSIIFRVLSKGFPAFIGKTAGWKREGELSVSPFMSEYKQTWSERPSQVMLTDFQPGEGKKHLKVTHYASRCECD